MSRQRHDRGEVSATTVVLAAALIALAIAVGVIITARVQDKANSIDLGGPRVQLHHVAPGDR